MPIDRINDARIRLSAKPTTSTAAITASPIRAPLCSKPVTSTPEWISAAMANVAVSNNKKSRIESFGPKRTYASESCGSRARSR